MVTVPLDVTAPANVTAAAPSTVTELEPDSVAVVDTAFAESVLIVVADNVPPSLKNGQACISV